MTVLKQMLKLAVVAGMTAFSGLAHAEPVTVRVGHGSAAEEPLWLMKAAPEATPNQGKAYALDFTLFRGSDKRFQAFMAGELEIATGSAHAVLMAASRGAKFKIVASLSREGGDGFATQYMVMADSPIHSVADLKGKTVGINGARSSAEIWARMVLEKNGLDASTDVTWAALPFPSQGEAVRAGKLDIGAFPQPFAAFEDQRGGMRTVFTSMDGTGQEEDLIVLMATEKFAAEQPEALKAVLADLVSSTGYLTSKREAALKSLVDAKFISVPLDVLSSMKDYNHPKDAKVDLASMQAMLDHLVKFGFIENPVDLKTVVDLSYLPN